MWRIHSLFEVILAAAAILFTVIVHQSSNRESELLSEALAWLLLRAIFPDSKRVTIHESPGFTWVAAVSIGISSFYRAENILAGSLAALIPLILESGSLSNGVTSQPFNAVTTILVSIISLTDWNVIGILLSISPLIAVLCLYTVLSLATTHTRQLKLSSLPREHEAHAHKTGSKEAVKTLSIRVLAILAPPIVLDLIMSGIGVSQVIPILTLGLIKTVSWYFLLQLTAYAPHSIVTAVMAFAITATRNPYVQSSGIRALFHVLASMFSLALLVNIIPKRNKARMALWAFCLFSLLPYTMNIVDISSVEWASQHFDSLHEHPVETMIIKAQDDFSNMMQKQSRSYDTACEEYRRRYNLDPPPGFKAWYKSAKHHKSPIIDDFDSIYHAISPFLKLSGKKYVDNMNLARQTTNIELWSCELSGGKSQCVHPYRSNDRHLGTMLDKVLETFQGTIPNIRLLINHLDEPRVLVPPFRGDDDLGGNLDLKDLSRQNVWVAVTKYCASQQNTTSLETGVSSNSYSLPFITDPRAAKDLCAHPEYREMHGLLLSPTSFRLIEGHFPVLSTGSLSTMGDILLPSPAYTESEFQYDEKNDIDWKNKGDRLYWAGSTTGGYAVDEKWRSYHRQRFLNLGGNLGQSQYYYLHDAHGEAERVRSSFLNGRLYDVAVTRIFQCDRKYCRQQSKYFNVKQWANKDEAFRSKLVFDLDGNGISGRFYKLLASRSTPLKQTLLREWHDDRLVPWVHYIPISQSMEELPEVVSWLTSTTTGQRRAKEIAEQGRNWFNKALREIDMSLYIYRLFLELSRLQDLDREGIEV